MCLYSIVPFLLMTIFNVLLMKKTWFKPKLDRTVPFNRQIIKGHMKRKRATASQVVLSSLFLLMTLPTSFAYGVFLSLKEEDSIVFACLDYLLFFHNSALFLRCFISYRRFRQIFIKFLFKIMRPLRSIRLSKN